MPKSIRRFLIRGLVLIGVVLALTGCGSVATREPAAEDAQSAPSAAPSVASSPATQSSSASASADDPWEGFNRVMYSFNDKLDRYVLKPVAKGYSWLLPDIVRKGVSNFFSNLHDPVIMVNNLLQGKFTRAASDLGRFVINSTIGILGLFDVASHFDLEKHDEDFGQTLAVWGVGEGPYLVLPIFGPSSLRDGLGLVPDWKLYPVNYVEENSTRYELLVLETVNRRAQLLDASDILEQAAGEDPYVFVREAYRQRRLNLIYDGNPPTPKPDSSLFDDDPSVEKKKGEPESKPATGGSAPK